MRNINLQSIQQNPYLDSIIQVTQGKNMIADGPLSLQYTKALNEIYKKEVDDTTGISLETQANDEIVSKSLWVAASNTRQQLADQGQEVGMLYGVKKAEASVSNVIEVTDAVQGMTSDERENSVIILDGEATIDTNGELKETDNVIAAEDINPLDAPVYLGSQQDVDKPIPPEDSTVNPFAATIEAVALENNIELYHSLEEYVESNKMKDGIYPGTISGKKVSFKIGKKTH